MQTFSAIVPVRTGSGRVEPFANVTVNYALVKDKEEVELSLKLLLCPCLIHRITE